MLIDSELTALEQTASEMHRLAKAFRDDMIPWAALTPMEFFNVMKSIPYKEDPESVEFLQRPYYTMSQTGDGGDCDDKAIAVAAWANLRCLPYRFVAVAVKREDDLHHVFTELFLGGEWIAFDTTYAFNIFGHNKHYEKKVEL